MRQRPWGTTGWSVPVVGIGTWNMEGDRRDAAVAATRKALDVGCTHVDTAELYGSGRVETLVGEAIAGRRDEVFLVSKVLPSNASRQGTIGACEASLRRLGTDRLDSYLLHWPGRFPLADTVAAFEDLVRAGKIRSWGISNFDERGMAEFERLAPGRCSSNQVLYHLEERAVEHAVLPACARSGVSLVSYSPFGSTSRPWGANRGILEAIGRAHGVSAHAVALAWLLRDPAVLVIPKSSDAAHVAANAAAGEVVLGAAELASIDAAFPRGPRQPGVPTI